MRIIESAIRLKDGRVFTGRRHHNVIAKIVRETDIKRVIGEQGFIAEDGQFYAREQAAQIALASGQIAKLKFHSRELFSEDLY